MQDEGHWPRLSKNSPVLSWKVVSRVHSLLAFSLFRGNKGDENFSPTPPHNQKLVRFSQAQHWASADLPHPPSAAISITNQPRRRNCRLVWKARTVLGTPGGSRGPFHVPDHFEMLPNSVESHPVMTDYVYFLAADVKDPLTLAVVKIFGPSGTWRGDLYSNLDDHVKDLKLPQKRILPRPVPKMH